MPTAQDTALARYRWASEYVNGLIQGPPSPPADATAEDIRARALARMDRLRRFLAFLGDPQQQFRSIHVGGTSGKGSTSAFIASILTAGGYRAGLHVSPYLQVETEKLQIDGRLLSAHRYAEHVAALAEANNRWRAEGGEPLTYGEFWVALTFYAMAREEVELAVIEVGAGGRFDLTNLLLPEVAVITSVGIDHVRTLGNTIPEIAWHKAGIIKPGRPAVTTVQRDDALEVIRREAAEQQAKLIRLDPDRDYEVMQSDLCGTRMVERETGLTLALPLPGEFQVANAAAAIAAVRALDNLPRGPIDDNAIAQGLQTTRFPGRMEIVQREPLVLLDGAHNPEKMASLARNVSQVDSTTRRVLVLGSLDSHDFIEMARIIAPVASEVIVTAPSAVQRSSASTEDIVEVVREAGLPVEVVPDPLDAIRAALDRVGPEDQVLVTGSLYLVGAVREWWYPTERIVLEQTSWPAGIESDVMEDRQNDPEETT